MTGPTFFEDLIQGLEEYAAFARKLAQPVSKESTTTLQQHLEHVEQQTGKTPQTLKDAPELPEAVAHVWGWYCEIRRTGMPTYAELQAWAQLRRTEPRPWEIDALRRVHAVMEAPND